MFGLPQSDGQFLLITGICLRLYRQVPVPFSQRLRRRQRIEVIRLPDTDHESRQGRHVRKRDKSTRDIRCLARRLRARIPNAIFFNGGAPTEHALTNMVDVIDSYDNYTLMRSSFIPLLITFMACTGCTLLDDPPDFPRITTEDARVQDAKIMTRDFGVRTSDAFQPPDRMPIGFDFDLGSSMAAQDAATPIDGSRRTDGSSPADVAVNPSQDAALITDGGPMDVQASDTSVVGDGALDASVMPDSN